MIQFGGGGKPKLAWTVRSSPIAPPATSSSMLELAQDDDFVGVPNYERIYCDGRVP